MSPSPPRPGSLHRGLAAGRAVRFLATELAGIANITRERHDLDPDATRIAAEALVAASLMSAWIKGEERITLQIQGEQPRFSFMADVDSEGGLRARLTPASVPLPKGGNVNGLIYAIRADVSKEIYRGVSAIEDQTIERALAAHVRGSEQMDAFLRIGVSMGEDGRVRSAGGIVVERLPEEPGLPSMSREDFRNQFAGIEDQPAQELLLALAFGTLVGEKVEILENRELHWRCGCSQERIEAVLYNLGVAELRAILAEQGGAEVACHFCNLAYTVDADGIQGLIDLHEQTDEAPT